MKEKIYNLLKQESSKYNYFFLTITLASIAFVVKIILDKRSGPNYELLLSTIVLLFLSFLSALKNILLYRQELKYEFAIEDIEEKTKNPDIKTKAKDWVSRRLDKNDKKLKCWNNWPLIFFMLSMLSFVLWLTIKSFESLSFRLLFKLPILSWAVA